MKQRVLSALRKNNVWNIRRLVDKSFVPAYYIENLASTIDCS